MSKKHNKHLNEYKHITLADLYLHYPYKYWDKTSKTIPRKPYVPIKDISDHVYKLDFKTWKLIIMTYLEFLFKFIFDGFIFRMPYSLGSLKIVKIKYKTPSDKMINFYQKIRKYCDDYFPKLKWYNRGWNVHKVKFKNYFEFRITRHRYNAMLDEIIKDRSILYRFPTEGSVVNMIYDKVRKH